MDSIISPEGCGVGRESVLMNGQCFRWYANYTQQQDIQFGRSAKPGEVPNGYYIDKSDITVYPGIQSIQQLPRGYSVDQLYAYPDYMSGKEVNSDIGLIKLKQWIPLSTTTSHTLFRPINAICLPSNSRNSSNDRYSGKSVIINQLALVAGFGAYDNDGHIAVDRLHMGWVYLVNNNNNNDDLNYYVTRYPRYNGTVICSGDSGGPLYQYINGRAVLIGIAQGTDKPYTTCLDPNDNNNIMSFVRILPHLDWITNIVSNN
ncbi:transmembrane protease serine 11D-like [Oppia nitens]|uniref:transmembrane protease serine 11D-like n=1 Tax=Oppia nitens TaxID=1686743 RepID=UPI0023DB1B63|nr:transmembrane protease serine 11D-like [Oppia nitens]